jgi:hypothetical protein
MRFTLQLQHHVHLLEAVGVEHFANLGTVNMSVAFGVSNPRMRMQPWNAVN